MAFDAVRDQVLVIGTCCAPRRRRPLEQAHAEAFAKLTPEQHRHVLGELSASTPERERGVADDPEMHEPGTMKRARRPHPATISMPVQETPTRTA